MIWFLWNGSAAALFNNVVSNKFPKETQKGTIHIVPFLCEGLRQSGYFQVPFKGTGLYPPGLLAGGAGAPYKRFRRRRNFGAGAALPPRAFQSRMAKRADSPRSPQKRASAKQMPFFVELLVGIEPTTFSLRVRCSAIEPQQRMNEKPARTGYEIEGCIILPDFFTEVKHFPEFPVGRRSGRNFLLPFQAEVCYSILRIASFSVNTDSGGYVL